MTPDFKLNIEVTYQPINKTYGCKIHRGNIDIFEVDHDLIACVTSALERYTETVLPTNNQ